MRLIALCGLIGLITSCAQPSGPLDIGFDTSGTNEEFIAAQQAAFEWNDTCKRELVHVHWGQGEIPFYGRAGLIEGRALAETRTHSDNNPAAIVYQNDNVSGYPLMQTFAHELGHALGILEHTTTGLMRPSLPVKGVVGSDGRLMPGMISQEQCNSLAR